MFFRENFILTNHGYRQLDSIIDKKVSIWTGKRWASTTFTSSGTLPAFIVFLTNGNTIRCTQSQVFILANSSKKSLSEMDCTEYLRESISILFDTETIPGYLKENTVFKFFQTHEVDWGMLGYNTQDRDLILYQLFCEVDAIITPSKQFLKFAHLLALSCGQRTEVQENSIILSSKKPKILKVICDGTDEVFEGKIDFEEQAIVVEGLVLGL